MLTHEKFFSASGIIALILQQRPDLTWRDVKHVIAKGSVPIDTSSPSWTLNGGGYRHSYQYGFGLMKVPSLLLAARNHVRVPTPFKTYYSPLKTFDGRTASIPFTWNHTVQNSNITFIEHVILYVGISHEMRGNVQLKLISPHGTESVLATERPKDVTFNYPQRFFPKMSFVLLTVCKKWLEVYLGALLGRTRSGWSLANYC